MRKASGENFIPPQEAQDSQGEFQLYKGGNRGIFHHRIDSQGPSKLLQRTATRLARRPGMDAVLCAAAKDVRVIISASGLAGGIIRTSLLCPTEPMPFCFFLILDPPWMGLGTKGFVVNNSASAFRVHLSSSPLCFDRARDPNPFRAMRCIGDAVLPSTRRCGE